MFSWSVKSIICQGYENDKCLLDKVVSGETSKPVDSSDRELALEICLTSLVFQNLELDMDKGNDEICEEVNVDKENFSSGKVNTTSTGNVIEDESLAYIGGYIVNKFSNKYPHLGYRAENCGKSTSWTEMVNRGQLYMPSEEFSSQLHIMREVFKAIQGDGLREGPMCVKTLSSEIESAGICLPSDVIEFFARISVFFRMRYLNRIITFNKKKDACRSLLRKKSKIIA